MSPTPAGSPRTIPSTIQCTAGLKKLDLKRFFLGFKVFLLRFDVLTSLKQETHQQMRENERELSLRLHRTRTRNRRRSPTSTRDVAFAIRHLRILR